MSNYSEGFRTFTLLLERLFSAVYAMNFWTRGRKRWVWFLVLIGILRVKLLAQTLLVLGKYNTLADVHLNLSIRLPPNCWDFAHFNISKPNVWFEIFCQRHLGNKLDIFRENLRTHLWIPFASPLCEIGNSGCCDTLVFQLWMDSTKNPSKYIILSQRHCFFFLISLGSNENSIGMMTAALR